MKLLHLFSIVFIAAIASSCSITRPRLSYSGSQYNSVSDDILLYNSTQQAVAKLGIKLEKGKKLLLVQIVDNDINDFLADRVYEELYKRGFIVALTKSEDLKEKNTDIFDSFLMFYPTVYGTESAETEPTFYPKMVAAIPIVGWLIGRQVLAGYTYVDRQAGVSIHARLVDAKTGQILWIEEFTGQDKIRLEGGTAGEILFPNK